jgi:hypothetical protein
MVLALALKAELNGVTSLRPVDTEESPFYYTFKVQCTSCRETHPNWVSVSRFEQNEVSGSKGEANFVWKCKNCKVNTPQSPITEILMVLEWSVNGWIEGALGEYQGCAGGL